MAKKTVNMKNFVDRREGVRANRVVAVKHRLVKRSGKKQPGVWSLSSTKNMSVSGLLFMSPVPYKLGDMIELEVVISGVIEIYNGLAKVIRIHESSGRSFDVAAKYVEVAFKRRPAKSHLK